MRTESSFPTPVHGVSTLAPRNRAVGQAGVQENMRSDPVAKLTRRPSLRWDAFLLTTSADTKHHSYYRNGKEYRIIIEDTGVVHAFVDNVEKTVTGDITAYIDTLNLTLETINDTTFVVNKNKTVELLPTTDENVVQKYAHLSVASALNYGETLTVVAKVGIFTYTESITVSSAEDAVVADVERRTNQVATDIAAAFNINANIRAVAKGSAVALYDNIGNDWVTLEVSAGNGDDDVIAFNRVSESISGLPLYAVAGTRITVQPDPTDTDGRYYLHAVGLEGNIEPSAVGVMEEVVWTETRSPIEPHTLDETTMPHSIVYDEDTDTFTVGVPTQGWDSRKSGDEDSCPAPVFVGNKISALGQFQKRLVLVSGNDLSMTQTDTLYNWWKNSAVGLLVTDPISITSNSTGIDTLQHIIEHNRDLLLIASNGQFKIDGTKGITPQTVSMPLTTSQEIQISVPPITIGTSVFLPINYGKSTGITEYTGKRDQVDLAEPITHHVNGYMLGEADILVGSPNLEMVALTSTGSAQNEIFIYEQFTSNGKKTQQSWSKWILPIENEIVALDFRRDRLSVTCKVGDDIIVKQIEMYSNVALNTVDVFLDDMLTLQSVDGTTITLPTTYPTRDDIVIVGGDGTEYPLFKVQYTRVGNVVTFKNNISGGVPCEVYVGSPYRSVYRPTRPFHYDVEGIAVTTDRLRVSRYILSLVDTERVSMDILSEYSNFETQEVTARRMNRNTNIIGEVQLYTGNAKFSFAQPAKDADAEFYTDGYLGLTIAGISWQGQYHKSSRRM